MTNQIEDVLDNYESPIAVEYETECLACDGTGIYLGTLGRLAWYCCRHCGIEFNIIS